MTTQIKSSIDDNEPLCRGCLQQINQTTGIINLFDNFLDETQKPTEIHTISDMFSKYTSIEINEMDKLPSNLCAECYQKLENFHVFRQICIASNMELIRRKMLVDSDDIDICVKEEYNDNENEWGNNPFTGELNHSEENASNISNDSDIKLSNFNNKKQNIYRKSCASEAKTQYKMSKDQNKDEQAEQEKEKRTKIKCKICHQIFVKQHTFDGHMRKHKGMKEWKCGKCGKEYTQNASLQTHMKLSHPEEFENKEKYICGINDCGKVYYAKYLLRLHMFSVHITTNVKICEQCGKQFPSLKNLRSHSTTHSQLKRFKCHLCPKTYKASTALKYHIMEHEDIRKYECNICGKRYTLRYQLLRHMNYHTKEKQYPCKLCSTVLYTAGNLTYHMKIKHYGVKKFKCRYCDRKFGKREKLIHHERIHTGEKPHACPECGRRFIQLCAMKSHLRTHNKNQT